MKRIVSCFRARTRVHEQDCPAADAPGVPLLVGAHQVHRHASVMGISYVTVTAAVAAAIAVGAFSCSSALPTPLLVPQPKEAFSDVPYPPPSGKVEYVPDQPCPDAKWVDGQWRWLNTKWHWERGGWYEVPPTVRFAKWEARRDADGKLLFAPATWRDSRGHEAPTPRMLARGGAGPNTVQSDAGEDEADTSSEAVLADPPTLFDGPLYDAAIFDGPILGQAGLGARGFTDEGSE